MDKLTAREQFLYDHSPGDTFYFGSNVYGDWNEDGTVWYNTHNCEQYYFENVEDFLSFWYDNDESVNHSTQYYIGERDTDGDGADIFNDGCSEEKDGIDESEDGSMIWSAIKVYKNGEEVK